MKKKKKKKKQKKHLEAKGLFLLGLGILFLLSLFSFIHKDPSKNYLGIIGYSISWITTATFGFGSYLISAYLIYMGWKLISLKHQFNFTFKTISFSILLISTCILLNLFSQIYPEKFHFLQNKIFREKVYIKEPYPQFYIRYNTGGIPFYYLYVDIPLINLKNLLSNVGILLIFSTTSIISFLLISGIHIPSKLKTLLSLIKKLLRKIPNISRSVFKKNEQIPITTQKYTPHPPPPKYLPPKKNFFLKKEKKINKPIFKKRVFFKNSSYFLPSSSLLSNPSKIDIPTLKKELQKQAEILEATLMSFSIKAKVGEINCGPTITSFEVHPAIGVKVQKIKTLEKDIALNLQAKSIRIIAPIPGKAAVGVEIPSIHPQTVTLKEMLLYYQRTKRKHRIPLLLGKTVSGDHVITDLAKMPHLLIAGATGSGKSVCINTMVMSILMNLSPSDVKLIMIDPKKVELTQYSNLPHMIAPVITEAHGAYAALQWLVKEMQKRYEILKQLGLRNMNAFNSRKIKKDFEGSLSIEIPEKMPLIIAIIDEFADLMMVSSTDLETPIARIAQMARAVGIHLILATQRPSREVITGIIKANFPSRIAFKVASRINSQIILDENGAEALLGNGDLLFLPPGSSHVVRAQGAYISDEDINKILFSISEKHPTNHQIDSFDAMGHPSAMEEKGIPKDKLYYDALDLVLRTKNASTTFLQRKLKIGYARAASLIDELEENNIIGPQEGSKPRQILRDLRFFKNSKP